MRSLKRMRTPDLVRLKHSQKQVDIDIPPTLDASSSALVDALNARFHTTSKRDAQMFYEFVRPIMVYFHTQGNPSLDRAVEGRVERMRRAQGIPSPPPTLLTPPVPIPHAGFFSWEDHDMFAHALEQLDHDLTNQAGQAVFLCNTNVDQEEEATVLSLVDVYDRVNNADDEPRGALPVTGGGGFTNDEWLLISPSWLQWMKQMLFFDDPQRHTTKEFLASHTRMLGQAAQLGDPYAAASWVRTKTAPPIVHIRIELSRRANPDRMVLVVVINNEVLLETDLEWVDTRERVRAVLRRVGGD